MKKIVLKNKKAKHLTSYVNKFALKKRKKK